MKRSKRISLLILILFLSIIIILLTQIGFYTIQPIGAIPEGSTWLVRRVSGEPFFNSADAACLKATGNVSLLSRGLALAQAPKDRIIMRLPYWEFAYLRSTGGIRFEK